MSPRRPTPLLSFPGLEMQRRPPLDTSHSPTYAFDELQTQTKRWYHYLPLCLTVLLILAPHPSLLYMLVDFHLLTMHQTVMFGVHLICTYTLTFMALSSLIICVVRDPGPVVSIPSRGGDEDGEMGLTEALMPDIDLDAPGKWCRQCWAPKPERAHHCSMCGRCVLKMDHHCPWLGSVCIGHRTYPAFVHFLCCITLLAVYIAVISIKALWYAFNNPLAVNEMTPVHELCLSFAGLVATLVIGSFASYHIYLVSINQTTLENITPFMLLRHLPPLPRSGHSLSDPPLEPELSYEQRRLVKDAHGAVRLYDVGLRKNWDQIFGWNTKLGWLYRLWCGGATQGDGRNFPRNPRADEMLARLATELVKVDRNL
ncbi:DHHC palmitoyltransferase-domain-containing protein [Crucibulum laeve]|uniref:Palmitoyltransferase n=1 Tax=Crucibulum laeve TaxID=68775 RepID=A0A5C3M7B9_9AGAR|nr:DHHC palmitoyltransferase-domain-containing protein [Crucibulum laeve]